jgi:phosphoserine phosphatase
LKLCCAAIDKNPTSRNPGKCQLPGAGWNPKARQTLERVIERGAGRGLPVVFDFDNTIISGDVGEAVLAWLAAQNCLSPRKLGDDLCPPVLLPGKGKIQIRRCSDVMEYYEALLSPTVHGPLDPAPLANGYVWATQALEGLTVAEVFAATAAVFQIGRRSTVDSIESGRAAYPAPRFREEIVDLIARLIQFKYDVWIVSASNVWSVRWMVIHGLNPLLRVRGLRRGLRPDRVVGLATLLNDRRGRFYKDSVLIREDKDYAALRGSLTKSLRLSRHLEYPAPIYSGKVACILDYIGSNPYLCAGDSPSDHPMMLISKYRLWISRQEKRQSQQLTRALMRRKGERGWILQAATMQGVPRLIPDECRC